MWLLSKYNYAVHAILNTTLNQIYMAPVFKFSNTNSLRIKADLCIRSCFKQYALVNNNDLRTKRLPMQTILLEHPMCGKLNMEGIYMHAVTNMLQNNS